MLNKLPEVALIGVYPPPWGGVSIHIQRLYLALRNRGISCRVYDIGHTSLKSVVGVKTPRFARLWLITCLWMIPERIVHYHGKSWMIRAWLLILRLRNRSIGFTFHSMREDTESWGLWRKAVARHVVRHAAFLIGTNQEIASKLTALGAHPEKLHVIPAYLPPQSEADAVAVRPILVAQLRNQHYPLIVANASTLTFHDGTDLYGVDLCIELCKTMKSEFPQAGCVICLPNIDNPGYFAHLSKRVSDYDLSAHFHLLTEPIDFQELLTCADVFVRPTSSDGDSLSLREALAVGTPAVASDVVERPHGTYIFRSRDITSFHEAVYKALNGPKPALARSDDYLEHILLVYQNCTA